ncbi:MAG TPA: beta-ketoacyl synthase N-terminal-like domain-containing protein [Acidimicrobiales bacterium]
MPDTRRDRIAVVGMGCVFPGAPTVDDLWRNVCAGVDAIGDVPPDRWDPVFYAPVPEGAAPAPHPDRFYCRRGGFVDEAAFDPAAFGVMPIAVDGAEPDQFIALTQAAAALADSGDAHERVPADRVGVIVGRGGYRTPGVARLDQRVHVARQLVEGLRALLPDIAPERLAQVHEEFVRALGPDRPEASIGLVPNLVASRIANRFDFQGPAFAVDAACASTLVAVDHAVAELASGRCDLVVAGGTHHCHDVTLWSVFTQLRALSPSQAIRPFSRHADGLLVGEGTGFFVLKRLADAERDDDRVYAVICGSAVASDGRAGSLMSPNPAGQALALERAWTAAGLDPATVGLVEAHGTGTPAGDQAELETLRMVFGKADGGERRAGLGSIKSMIGHAMPAAGAAGLAKAALALHHRVLPPTLHADDPHPLVEDTRFRLLREAEAWESVGPRRAGVNAFGFGGVNAHLVLEEHTASRHRQVRRRPPSSSSADHRPIGAMPEPVDPAPAPEPPPARPAADLPPVLLLAALSPRRLAAQLRERVAALTDPANADAAPPSIAEVPDHPGPTRLAVVDVTPRRLELAQKIVAQGVPWRGRNGVWFEPAGLLGDAGGRLAFLFPGVEPAFDPQVDDVARHFGLESLAAPLRPGSDDDGLPALERQSRGIIAVGRVLHRALATLGVRPDMVAGHSLGEWTGEVATGVIPDDRFDEFVERLRPGAVEVADVVFLALGCGVDVATELLAGLARTTVSHDNCPHQSVVCGPADEIAAVAERCRERRILAQELPFRSGFHSPLFEAHLPAVRAAFADLALESPRLPLWSATTCAPYPTDPDEVRALAARHLVEPVRFRELLEALHKAGARVFVQMGVGNLVGFVDDTLGDRDVMAVAANTPKRTGLEQLCQVAGALWVQGLDVDVAALVDPPAASAADTPIRPRPSPTLRRLDLGTRLVRDLTPLETPAPAPATAPVSSGNGSADGTGPLADVPAAAAAITVVEGTGRNGATPVVPVAPADNGSGALATAPATAPVVPAAPAAAPPGLVERRRLGLDTEPAWADHAFFRQRDGWPYPEDRFPLVPMTGIVELLADTAHRLHPGLVPIAVEEIAAFRWLAVDPAVEITLRATTLDAADGIVRVRASIDGHARATVVLAPDYPEPPADPPTRLRGERPSHIAADRFYVDRHMFHGPAYQGVRAFLAVGDDGSRAIVKSLPAPGALLDNAGQLMGHWLTSRPDGERLVLPTSIGRIAFFGPHPAPGTLVHCTLRVTHLDDTVLRGDHELRVDDRLWCRITDWEDRRFAADTLVFDTLKWPERTGMSVERSGFTVAGERWPDSATRALVMRRYLSTPERDEYERHNPLAQRQFLLGRVAVKDAVRRWLWAHGHGPLFPAEVAVANDPLGRPLVRGPFDADLRVSLAHVEGLGVALVGDGVDVGIDAERVDPRRPSFEALVLTPGERQLAPPDGFERDAWLTVLWAAKEAAAKAGGRGLDGRPKDFEVLERQGHRLRIGHRWIAFERLPPGCTPDHLPRKEHIVAWTVTDR